MLFCYINLTFDLYADLGSQLGLSNADFEKHAKLHVCNGGVRQAPNLVYVEEEESYVSMHLAYLSVDYAKDSN